MENHIYEVSELNQMVKSLLDNTPALNNICVRGEISNYKFDGSKGHHYFSLKDQDGAISCAFFRFQTVNLRFRPQNGMKVLAVGRVSLFPKSGTYQFYCNTLAPDGVGDLHLAFEQLKEKLWREGLFAPEHKRPLPPYPGTIGIITSPTGDAIHDMIRNIRYRYPLVKVLLMPVKVQGEEAPPSIVRALRYACRNHVADVLIVGRGGGSAEDLWAFNDEQVARAIYEADIPVISAVGHEPDVTIADYVADMRAATPTHAAVLAVPNQAELLERLQNCRNRMLRAQNARLESQRRRLENLTAKRVMTDPAAFIQDKRMLLDHVQKNLYHAAEARLTEPRRRLSAIAASLDAMSPLKVLGRGYTMVTDGQGKVLRRASDAAVGDRVAGRMADGTLYCRVEEIALEGESE